MPKLVRARGNNSISIQFHCSECGNQFVTSIDNYMKSYTCPSCRARVNTLPVHCDFEDCAKLRLGRYIKCDGTIRRITGEERNAEEKKAFEAAQDISVGARPTDSFHDDIQDIHSAMLAYKCDNCGVSYSSASGISRGFDSGTVKCQRFLCDKCGRFPELQDLPEPDSGADNTPLNLFVEN